MDNHEMMFTGKMDIKALEEAYYNSHKQFMAQDVDREFGRPEKANKPEMTFREIAEELGVNVSCVHNSYRAAIVKMRKGMKAAGFTREDAMQEHRPIFKIPNFEE